MSPSPKRPAILWLGWLLQPWFAATLFIAWYLWQVPSQWQYDSMELYRGCRGILDWMQGRSPTVGITRQFPLFQYISGVAAMWAVKRGMLVNIYVIWCTCSLLGLAGIIIVFHRVAKHMNRPAVGWAIMVIMLSGPLLMYAHCTFNELVAAFLILCFTAAVTGSTGPVVCASLFWLGGITKETAPAILAVIWIGTMWIHRSQQNRRRLLTQGIALAIALIATIATNASFNFLRYRTVWNLNYLQPHELIRPWSWRAQYCLALWLSPSGGIVMFWPTLIIPMIGVMVVALRKRQSAAPAAMVAIILGGLTWGLSGWYTPFGWEAWGPRLMLPWMPAALLILLRAYPDACGRFVDLCVRDHRVFVITATISCVCALPHVMAAAEPRVVGPFFDNDWRFPHGASPLQPEQYYAQNLYLAWQKMPPLLLRPLLYEVTPLQVTEAICFIAALLMLLRQCQIQNGLSHRAKALHSVFPD